MKAFVTKPNAFVERTNAFVTSTRANLFVILLRASVAATETPHDDDALRLDSYPNPLTQHASASLQVGRTRLSSTAKGWRDARREVFKSR